MPSGLKSSLLHLGAFSLGSADPNGAPGVVYHSQRDLKAAIAEKEAENSTTTDEAMKPAAAETAKSEPPTDEQKRHHKAVMVSVERHDNVVDTAVTLSHQGADIHSLTDLSREQRDDVISLLQEMQATIFSAISRLRDAVEPTPPDDTPPDPGSAPKPETDEKPTDEAPELAGTVSAPEEQTAPVDASLDIPGFLIRTEAGVPRDAPPPVAPPAPSPTPTPAAPTPKLKVAPHYLPAHRPLAQGLA
jgi:hypothetical protein